MVKLNLLSPTDLLAASIGSCISTIFAIKIQNENIDFNGFKIIVSKDMINEPFRRVNKLILNIYIPKSFDERLVKILENVVKSCPVTRSLLPEITIVKNYIYLEN
jgi:Predicted redox protein, regulator of disulfide bond formation